MYTQGTFVRYNKYEVINLAIRDRGKKKWRFAFGMPELIKALRDVWKDDERIKKPILTKSTNSTNEYVIRWNTVLR
ncbi:hypothetical protein QE429_003434 [Bacillus sp. SORGH_AS 510]|uniref:hypothetical protein n=1 Tax=Bacillus sp. SORGH_AS_0510 TaxID=3041771 RepID=UPI002789011F|nr:hypothetical protein [Bacillus sp. SORGH_AS_0510]MDQ1146607.1 hypothetical protein [Bacillus sp. SORGH_AS_0510]